MIIRSTPSAMAIIYNAKADLHRALGYEVEIQVKPILPLANIDPNNWITDVCTKLQVSREKVLSKDRHQDLVVARQMISYFLFKYSPLSQLDISFLLEYEDHTTVNYHCKKVTTMLGDSDPVITEAHYKCQQLLRHYATNTEQV